MRRSSCAGGSRRPSIARASSWPRRVGPSTSSRRWRRREPGTQGGLPRRRPGHALPSRYQGPAQGDAAARPQADIQYVVEEAVASGLDEIILVTGRNKRAIEDHFDAALELEY